ncbi:MAG: hypothetical protein MUC96_33855 [Myxococcaceae bacterium]|nr:hypothetical protein [Myxococcaceae bacterium]
MKTLVAALAVAFAVPAVAADFKCASGSRVEKGGSTQYTYKESSSEIRVEKGGSTKGVAVKRGSKWYVEIGGSTQATFENGKIEKGGSSWASVSEAQRQFDCNADVAATLWVLMQKGAL